MHARRHAMHSRPDAARRKTRRSKRARQQQEHADACGRREAGQSRGVGHVTSGLQRATATRDDRRGVVNQRQSRRRLEQRHTHAHRRHRQQRATHPSSSLATPSGQRRPALQPQTHVLRAADSCSAATAGENASAAAGTGRASAERGPGQPPFRAGVRKHPLLPSPVHSARGPRGGRGEEGRRRRADQWFGTAEGVRPTAAEQRPGASRRSRTTAAPYTDACARRRPTTWLRRAHSTTSSPVRSLLPALSAAGLGALDGK